MKRTVWFALMMLLLLTGCDAAKREAETIEYWRECVKAAEGVTFSVSITAQSEEEALHYGAACAYADGETAVTLTAPENIAGVTFRTAEDSAALEYDGVSLLLGSGKETVDPCEAVPLLMTAITEGRLLRSWREGKFLAAELEASESVTVTVWLAPDTGEPLRAEIAENGRAVDILEIEHWTTEEKAE